MQSKSYCLKHLNNQDLTAGLKSLVRDDQRLCAELLAHLAEVDARRLYLKEAAPSLFAYCVEVLNIPEDAAYKTYVEYGRRFMKLVSECRAN